MSSNIFSTSLPDSMQFFIFQISTAWSLFKGLKECITYHGQLKECELVFPAWISFVSNGCWQDLEVARIKGVGSGAADGLTTFCLLQHRTHAQCISPAPFLMQQCNVQWLYRAGVFFGVLSVMPHRESTSFNRCIFKLAINWCF